jgi:hypothetical protein
VSCPSLEGLAAWLVADHTSDAEETLEQHLFDCDRCAAKATQLESLNQRLRTMMPPVLTPERRRKLEETVRPLPIAPVSPGERATLEFGPGSELGLWVMHADLRRVERLDCELLASDGSPLAAFRDVPFDAQRGEVVLGCQIHYRHLGFPDDMVVRVTSVDSSGRHPLAEYHLSHLFNAM